MGKIIIGLPAYNESIAIAKLLDRINIMRNGFETELEAVVVNDGSNDDTEEYLKDYSNRFSHITYINHPVNQGLAQAMRTIIDYSTKNFKEDDILIVLDSDNTHNPTIIPAMVDKLVSRDLDIVIASRFEPGGEEIGLSLDRKILSRGATLFAKIFFNVDNVKDYSCGFRAYKIGFLNKMKEHYGDHLVEADGFECMIELIVKSGILGAKVGEYPLVLEYNLKETPSKMNASKTIKGYLKLGLKHNRLKRMWRS